ncbi:MAG: DUF4013 domain-containing protein [Chloroflexi bacterium]|nr:DUF4013 domain-containing protein [Chloroflexota bacterium]
MDFGKALTFMFQDPNWVAKLGIGILVTLAGIVFSPVLIGFVAVFVLTGYTIDVVRNVLDGKEYPLPEWQDWGGFLTRGLKLFGVMIILALPFIPIMIPFGIGSALASSENQAVNVIGVLFMVFGFGLALLYGLFLVLIQPAIYVRLARTDRFAAALDVGRLWGFTVANIGNVIIALLLTIVTGLIAAIISPLGLLAFIIGVLVTILFASFWQMLVQAHLYGQVGALSKTAIE